MQILETEGFERLTIRGLATKLGVAATSIYWHVGDKQALLDAVAERVITHSPRYPCEVWTGSPDRLDRKLLARTLLERPNLWPWSIARAVRRRCSSRPVVCWSRSSRLPAWMVPQHRWPSRPFSTWSSAPCSWIVRSNDSRRSGRLPTTARRRGTPRLRTCSTTPSHRRRELFRYTLGALVGDRHHQVTPGRTSRHPTSSIGFGIGR